MLKIISLTCILMSLGCAKPQSSVAFVDPALVGTWTLTSETCGTFNATDVDTLAINSNGDMTETTQDASGNNLYSYNTYFSTPETGFIDETYVGGLVVQTHYVVSATTLTIQKDAQDSCDQVYTKN